ncbi:nucleoporin NDC1-like [Rhopilema esculentum]|uniref:nucleoporin NDC1-like n=1 Tax=Rhopilema esculentum TaxID=499914 RepID=UPI0031E41090
MAALSGGSWETNFQSFYNWKQTLETEKWSKKFRKIDDNQELKWRTGAATFWAMAFMPFIVGLLHLTSSFRIFSPLLWIEDAITKVLSGWFLASVLVIQVLCIPLLLVHLKCTKVQVVPLETRWKQILFILHPRQLIWILAIATDCLILTIIFMSLIYDSIATNLCKNESKCISLFRNSMLFYGVLCGVRYGIVYFKDSNYVIQFPVIQEKRFFRTRAILPSCFKNSLISAVQSLKVFYILNILVGLSFGLLINVFSGYESMYSFALNALSIMNFSFVWLCMVIGTAIAMILNIAECLFKIFITQSYSFLLEKDFISDHRLLLQEALLSNNQVLKHLGFLDLCHIGKFDEKRRRSIFAISLPGGHPENWNLVLSQYLTAIEESVKKFHEAYSQEVKIRQTNVKSPFLASPSPSSVPAVTSPKTFPSTKTASLFSPVKYWDSTEDVSEINKKPRAGYKDHKQILTQKKATLLSWLFEERPDYKKESLFQDQQLVLWALEGLSTLITASFSEDAYGVVQRMLPDILIILMSYQETIEKFLQTSIADDKMQVNKLKDFQKKKAATGIAQSYKLAVQTAIYRITSKFGCHLDSVRIPREYRRRLDAFIEFRE